MSEESDRMREAVELVVLPVLIEMRFQLDARSLKMNSTRELRSAFPFGWLDRVGEDRVERVEIQFDTGARDRFALNFGLVPLSGIRKPWGTFSFEEIDSVAGLDESYRLIADPKSGKWFGPSGFFFDYSRAVLASAQLAVSCLPEIDAWSNTDAIGPHMIRVGFPADRLLGH